MASDQIQLELPPGIELQHRLHTDGVLGDVMIALDRRWCPSHPIRRVMRVIQFPEPLLKRKLPEKLMARAARLAELNIPLVDVPLQVGMKGKRLLVTLGVCYEGSLHDHLRNHSGLAPFVAEHLFRQLLSSLAGLHRGQLSHGDIRPQNVFLTQSDEGFDAHLGDTLIGQLSYWSGNHFGAGDPLRYFPPEWNGEQGEPNPGADNYALARVASEMLLGYEAAEASWDELPRKLRKKRVPRRLAQLLTLMLHREPDVRPRDASSALAQWRRLERRALTISRVVLCGAVALSVVLFLVCAALVGDLSTSRSQRAAAYEQTRAARAERDELNKRIEELSGEVALSVNQRPSETSSDQSAWTKAVNEAGHQAGPAEEQANRLLSKLANMFTAESRQANWLAEMRKAEHDFHRWQKHDPEQGELSRLFLRLVEGPWEPKPFSDRVRDLDAAAEEWYAWSSEELSHEKINDRVAATPSPAQKKILRGWLGQMDEKSEHKWTLVLKTGSAPDGYGTYRVLTVYSGGKDTSYPGHDWTKPTEHHYEAGSARYEFVWKRGDTLQFLLEGPRSYWRYIRPNLLDQTFSGGLAIWRAHSQGRVQAPDGKTCLTFEILDCPGPPPKRPLSVPIISTPQGG